MCLNYIEKGCPINYVINIEVLQIIYIV